VLDSERYGTRHRAAIGISEQTDALIIVVSEETGSISLVVRGRIERNLSEDRLRRRIFSLIRPQAPREAAPLLRRTLEGRWGMPEEEPTDPDDRVVASVAPPADPPRDPADESTVDAEPASVTASAGSGESAPTTAPEPTTTAEPSPPVASGERRA
jgi:hypothetical protein